MVDPEASIHLATLVDNQRFSESRNALRDAINDYDIADKPSMLASIHVHNAGSSTLDNVRLTLSEPTALVVIQSGTTDRVVIPAKIVPDYRLDLESLAPGDRIDISAWCRTRYANVRATHRNGHGAVRMRYTLGGAKLWIAENIAYILVILPPLGYFIYTLRRP